MITFLNVLENECSDLKVEHRIPICVRRIQLTAVKSPLSHLDPRLRDHRTGVYRSLPQTKRNGILSPDNPRLQCPFSMSRLQRSSCDRGYLVAYFNVETPTADLMMAPCPHA